MSNNKGNIMTKNNEEIGYEIDKTPPRKSGGLYIRRPDPILNARFYQFIKVDDDGKKTYVVGRPVLDHWIDKKRYDCTGKECELCKKMAEQTDSRITLSEKREVACVDRKNSPDKMQIYSMPMTVWNMLEKEISVNGFEIIGDSGRTYVIEYSANQPPALKYTLTAHNKDAVVLKNSDKLLYLNPSQAPDFGDGPKMDEEQTKKELAELMGDTPQFEPDADVETNFK